MNLLRGLPATGPVTVASGTIIAHWVVTEALLGAGTTGVVRLAKRTDTNSPQSSASSNANSVSAAQRNSDYYVSPLQALLRQHDLPASDVDMLLVDNTSAVPFSTEGIVGCSASLRRSPPSGKREKSGTTIYPTNSSSGCSPARGSSRTPSPPRSSVGGATDLTLADRGENHRSRNGVQFAAVKVVRKDVPKCHGEALHEIAILGQLQHRNIIRILEVHEDLRHLYIFTEYCDERDLYRFITEKRSGQPLPEQLAWRLFRQMCSALQYMHAQRICHSDFKLENCVINHDFELRVIDFAYACKIPQGKLIRKFNGSPAYAAPEILFRRPHDETVDLWSLGVCVFFMLCGYFPFCDEQSTTLDELALNVRAGVIDFPFEDDLLSTDALNSVQGGPGLAPDMQPVNTPTEAARDACLFLLSTKKRPAWHEIVRHPWFRIYESCSLR